MTSELLDGLVVAVTGAASGNGREIARAVARAGARVVLAADVREDPREGGAPTPELVAAESSAHCEFVRCDISRPGDLDALVARAEELGGLDVMVNNAGIAPPVTPITEVSDEVVDRVIDTNLKGTFYGCRAAARVMIPRGRGSIINMSSIAGFVGTGGGGVYGASKGGIRLLTYSLAVELGPQGIRVNAIHPGVIDTMMMREAGMTGEEEALRQHIPSGRVGRPAEIGDAVVYLASPLATYVNGASLAVDGGLSIAF